MYHDVACILHYNYTLVILSRIACISQGLPITVVANTVNNLKASTYYWFSILCKPRLKCLVI